MKKNPLFKLLYNLFKYKLSVFKDYINKNLKIEYINHLKSLIRVLILFIKKCNSLLQLYINYKRLNAVFIKNKYFIFLILKILNCL